MQQNLAQTYSKNEIPSQTYSKMGHKPQAYSKNCHKHIAKTVLINIRRIQ